MKPSLPNEKIIIGLLGLGLFIFGIYLMATNLEGMINSLFSQDRVSIQIAVVFGFAIIGLLAIGFLFMLVPLGMFEYKQKSRVKIYKGDQSEECLIDRMEG